MTDRITLTDAEKLELCKVVFRAPDFYAVVESIVANREAKAAAKAWDEGHEGCDCVCLDGLHGAVDGRACPACRNPYRDPQEEA